MTVTPITSEQVEQFDRFVLDGAKKARKRLKLTKDGLQRLLSRGGEFQEGIISLIDSLSAPAPDYMLAKSILGGDFVTPEEITAKRPVVYSAKQIEALAVSIPNEETLRWLKANGYALMAAPPSALSLLDIRDLNRQHFYSKEGGWYSNEQETFAHKDKTGFGWIMIRKTPVPDSTRKTWTEQGQLLSNVEFVPNVAEAVWFITTFYEVRGIRLFGRVYIRTSSIESFGGHVVVGHFDAEGLGASNGWDDGHSGALGVSSARKN